MMERDRWEQIERLYHSAPDRLTPLGYAESRRLARSWLLRKPSGEKND
jgi:hypothetical protein